MQKEVMTIVESTRGDVIGEDRVQKANNRILGIRTSQQILLLLFITLIALLGGIAFM